jgi:divinyl chlorophyllide a 8-vinyl-reductase
MNGARVCLAGATGYLGMRVAAAFRERNVAVTAIARSRSDRVAVAQLRSVGADIAFVDAARREPYRRSVEGVGTAVSCMASRNEHVDASSDFWAIDRDANIRFGLAAIAAGARHLLLVATFEGPASRRYSAFSDAKEQAVDTLGAASETAGIAFTVVRPTAYFSDLTDRAFASVAAHHRYTAIGDGLHRINPVDGRDVASFIAAHAAAGALARSEYPPGGPELFSSREIGELAGAVLGQREPPQPRRIPVDLLRLVATLAAGAGVGSAAMRRTAAILRWMIYAGTHDAIAPSCGRRTLRANFEAKAAARPVPWPART